MMSSLDSIAPLWYAIIIIVIHVSAHYAHWDCTESDEDQARLSANVIFWL